MPILKWTLEFEKMWRTRLQEMKNQCQPFHRFIESIVELELEDAFVLALDEIERLRNKLSEYKIRVARLEDYP